MIQRFTLTMTKDKAPSPITLYRFRSSFFNNSPAAAIAPMLRAVTTRINDGYDDIHGKHGYLDTICPRVESWETLVDDFHLDGAISYLLLLVKNDPSLTDGNTSELIKSKQIPLVEVQDESEFKYNELKPDDILGTMILKPHSDPAYLEPTGFVSFFKGTGRFLLEAIESLIIKEEPEAQYIRLQVLVCHELVPFYVKFGFEEYLEREKQEVKDGKVISGCMTGVPAHKAYEIAWMRKSII